jgi:hypothetical protein
VVGIPAATAAIKREEVAQAGGMPLGQLLENRRAKGLRPSWLPAPPPWSRGSGRRQNPRSDLSRRNAGNHAQYQSDACFTVRPSQGDGFDNCVGKRCALG